MSSLPQGWHGVIGTSKTTASSSTRVSGSSVPVTVRKKWNSPMSSNVPQTRLPSYKSSNLRQQNINVNDTTYQMKSPVAASIAQQTKLPTPTKPSPVKEYKNEIEKLKKELSTMKAENSILKAKVRRVDDENIQKGRQIEKMRAEIKSLQKNESGSIRKSRESQELHSLRQKCLRLENALKDKDLTIKKLTSESSGKKDNSESGKTSSNVQRQVYQVTTAVQLKNTSKSSEKESISAKSSLSRASLSLKTEVTKLRDMIHKLEKENQDLQQQAKLHCQEIRRLKIQMKSKMTPPQTSVSKSNVENLKNMNNKSVVTSNNPQTKTSAPSSFVPKQRIVKRSKSPIQVRTTSKSSIQQKTNLQKSIPRSDKSTSLSNGKVKQLSNNIQAKGVKSKLPVTKPSAVHGAKPVVKKTGVNKEVSKNADLERKAQEMRENIAAKKIQRSWRQHQKCLQHSPELEFHNGGKALTFIISSMKHHKLRRDKLNILVKKNHLPEAIKKEAFMEAIESISRKVWDQGNSTS